MKRYKCNDSTKKKEKEYTYQEVLFGSAPEGVYRRNNGLDEEQRVVIFKIDRTAPVVLFVSPSIVEPLDAFGKSWGFAKTDEIFKCSFGEKP